MNIEQAKQIPLEEFLSRIGVEPVRRTNDQLWYLSPIRVEKTPSFKVNRNMNAWYDFGQGEGGDILDLVKQMERVETVSEVLSVLDRIFGETPRPKLPPVVHRPKPTPAEFELLSIGPVSSKSLISYLKQRGINPQSVANYVKEAHYKRGDNRYFALAFANDSDSQELRNPFFKGTLGTKDITTIKGRSDRVVVFEGFFDFLTSIAMRHKNTDATTIVLNSVAMRDKAVESIRQLNPSSVELFRDRDDAGLHLLQFFKESLPQIDVIDKADLYAGFNDLNEWHAANFQASRFRRQG